MSEIEGAGGQSRPAPNLQRAVLLDVDGTLLDSNDAHTHAWIAALSRHGNRLGFETIRPYIGKGGDKLLKELLGLDAESPAGKSIDQARRDFFAQHLLASLTPTRGARAFVERCVAAGWRPIVATSSSGEELKSLLRQAGIDDLIDGSATSSDADRSKPDPDIVLAALEKAGPHAEAIFVGDTPHDIEAATRAQLRTVALRCGGWWNDAALAGAAAIYDDPAALLLAWERSPLGG